MAKATTSRSRKPAYRCVECGWQTVRWVGRCGECQAWGTVEEVGLARPAAVTSPGPVSQPAVPIDEIDVEAARAEPTGIGELDRVLGGGLVQGAVVLVAGEPGVGKSTLLLEVAAERARAGGRSLYVSGEESAAQVRLRAERVNAMTSRLYLAAETDLSAVLGHIDAVRPDLLVLDSVQTVASSEVEGVAGGVTQVREVAAALIRVAKERGIATIMVGHVTKDGSIAGPRLLEHLVDVVLHFEGDKHAALRMVRGLKNRFGAADEVGCFEMHEGGITSLPDPSGLFLNRHAEPVPGTCVTVSMEGRRALVTEVQALIGAAVPGSPRRTVSGLDPARLAMVLAVVQRCRPQIRLHDHEVFAATVGGIRVVEPAADLACALAVTSGALNLAVSADLVAIGEVGLTGEVRPVSAVARRLAEAARLGFRHALVPKGARIGGPLPEGIQVHEVSTLPEAMRLMATLSAAAGAGGEGAEGA